MQILQPRQLKKIRRLCWNSWIQRIRAHKHNGGEHGNRQAGMALGRQLRSHTLIHRHKAERERVNWEWHGSFDISKTDFSDIPFPVSPHILILPKQLHKLETKHLNMWTYGDHSHSNHSIPPPLPQSCDHIKMWKPFSQTSKVPMRLLQSQHCFTFQSLFWDMRQSFHCNPLQKEKANYILPAQSVL